MRYTCSVLCAALFFYSFGAQARGQKAEPTAETILQKMIETYGHFSTYQDSGVVRRLSADLPIASLSETSFQTGIQKDEQVSFKTYYLRRNRLRFEWTNSKQNVGRPSVLWYDGKRVYLWKPAELGSGFELTSHKDLGLQLDEATSSSHGAAFFVATLLLRNAATSHGFPEILSMATNTAVVREEVADSELCYVIKAKLSDVPWLLWIGKKSYLLRKTRTLYLIGVFDPLNRAPRESFLAEESHTNIRINRRLPKALFKYRPLFGPKDSDLTH